MRAVRSGNAYCVSMAAIVFAADDLVVATSDGIDVCFACVEVEGDTPPGLHILEMAGAYRSGSGVSRDGDSTTRLTPPILPPAPRG